MLGVLRFECHRRRRAFTLVLEPGPALSSVTATLAWLHRSLPFVCADPVLGFFHNCQLIDAAAYLEDLTGLVCAGRVFLTGSDAFLLEPSPSFTSSLRFL